MSSVTESHFWIISEIFYCSFSYQANKRIFWVTFLLSSKAYLTSDLGERTLVFW